MTIETFFDPATWTLTYLVYDEATRDAVVIDPVLDFDPLTVDVSTASAARVADRAEALGLRVHLVLDTHAHADHLSAFQYLKDRLGASIGIGREITGVQEVFASIFHFGDDFPTTGEQWDVLVEDGVPVAAGSLTIHPMHSPGHTPACYVFRIGDALFTGDVLFMPDFGTGRCDFPGGSASDLYDSIQRLYALDPALRVFVGHDYQPGGRELKWETTIGESRTENVHLRADTTREEFVAFRTSRDATLAPPKLIFQSLQVNAAAGVLPAPEANGRRYLRSPMGLFSGSQA
jgi:glyoxylase-like metal-dependent hydrolase (beta-lactamase superfamily II)